MAASSEYDISEDNAVMREGENASFDRSRNSPWGHSQLIDPAMRAAPTSPATAALAEPGSPVVRDERLAPDAPAEQNEGHLSLKAFLDADARSAGANHTAPRIPESGVSLLAGTTSAVTPNDFDGGVVWADAGPGVMASRQLQQAAIETVARNAAPRVRVGGKNDFI